MYPKVLSYVVIGCVLLGLVGGGCRQMIAPNVDKAISERAQVVLMEKEVNLLEKEVVQLTRIADSLDVICQANEWKKK